MSKFGDPDHPDPAEAGKETQFKPGESGNRSGHSKGQKNLTTWIQELMTDEGFEYVILGGNEKGKM